MLMLLALMVAAPALAGLYGCYALYLKKFAAEAMTLAAMIEYALFNVLAAPLVHPVSLHYPVLPLLCGYRGGCRGAHWRTLLPTVAYAAMAFALPHSALCHCAKWLLLAYNFAKCSKYGAVNGVAVLLLWLADSRPAAQLLCACALPWACAHIYSKLEMVMVLLRSASVAQARGAAAAGDHL